MKHFITFQKKKGLYIVPSGNLPFADAPAAWQIQHELMKYGYVLSKELFDKISASSLNQVQEIYADLCKGLAEVVGGSGYEPIYRNFPQSVQDMSYLEFFINAIMHYWSWGTWRPEDAGYLKREFKLEPVDYKEISLLTQVQFDNIFKDIIYSGTSISKWDKEIVDWYIDSGNAPEVDLGTIRFKETKAYLGKRFLESGKELPFKSATDVLRVVAAYSGGDEGLKENTRFKQPKRNVKKSLMKTLNSCFDLEESFKNYREVWLRVLYYLNPGTTQNTAKFPELAKYTRLLRNTPERLRTFNSYVEEYISEKNPEVFVLLNKRKGMFMRRMNQLFDVFGMVAVDEYLKLNPSFEQLVNLYNYFSDRAENKERATILAGQSKSDMVTYAAAKPIHVKTVTQIQDKLMGQIGTRVKKSPKKVFIDRSLYYSPLAMNNRASSFSLDSKAIGTVETLPEGKTVRCYVHWVGRSDIDLSGFIINKNNEVIKVGWNGRHTLGKGITYSGDNTGYSAKNAEYLDITLDQLPEGSEWIVVDAKVYRGPNYKKWEGGGVHAGWMMRSEPRAGEHWKPDTLDHAIKLRSDSLSAYLMAIHVETKSLVYLDVAQSSETIVTTPQDAIKMKIFLDKFVSLDTGETEVQWKKILQGHVIHLLSENLVSKEEAELIFDENTPQETVARALSEERI